MSKRVFCVNRKGVVYIVPVRRIPREAVKVVIAD